MHLNLQPLSLGLMHSAQVFPVSNAIFDLAVLNACPLPAS
jgi:hypothetical protein